MSEQPVERLGPCQELAGASVLLWPCRLWVCKPGPAAWSGGLEAGQRLPRPGQSPKHGMLTRPQTCPS